MPVQSIDVAMGEHQFFLRDEVPEADAGGKAVDGDERIALLVGYGHVVEYHLVEWRDAHVADGDVGV